MATSLVATAMATLGGEGGGEGGRAVGVVATMALTATTEEMLINGVLVVVSCRGQEYLSGAKNSYLDQKNKGKNFGETNRGTGTILMILI